MITKIHVMHVDSNELVHVLSVLSEIAALLFRSHYAMVKAVAVLGSSEGVTGTVYFSQDGNGEPQQ